MKLFATESMDHFRSQVTLVAMGRDVLVGTDEEQLESLLLKLSKRRKINDHLLSCLRDSLLKRAFQKPAV